MGFTSGWLKEEMTAAHPVYSGLRTMKLCPLIWLVTSPIQMGVHHWMKTIGLPVLIIEWSPYGQLIIVC
ncbi:hypothetical protein D3C85_1473460 [compost metagenome]